MPRDELRELHHQGLQRLSKSPYPNIRWDVAMHSNTPKEILISMKNDKNEAVRWTVHDRINILS